MIGRRASRSLPIGRVELRSTAFSHRASRAVYQSVGADKTYDPLSISSGA